MVSDSKCYLVLTAVGQDRPGLVERISALILGQGASLEDSRMAILGGEFALISLVSGTTQSLEQLRAQQENLAAELGLTLTVKVTERPRSVPDYLPYQLKVTGVDRPGIVAVVSALLAHRNINVAALDSQLSHAPLSGTPLFQLSARLQVPSELALSSLRQDLARLCEEENLDHTLQGP